MEPHAPPIQLYAELLPNIRQITFYISLTSDWDESNVSAFTDTPVLPPKLSVSDCRTTISVSYRDHLQSLLLPSRVSPNACRALFNPLSLARASSAGKSALEFSIRLQVDDTVPVGLQHDIRIPWTAKDLSSGTQVQCQKCGSELFSPRNNVEVEWKDLPNADWAEMMDLWHCHKPDPHEDDLKAANNAENEKVKGYGAANRVACAPGTGLVDVASFVLAENDCANVKKDYIYSKSLKNENTVSSESRSLPPATLLCRGCEAIVGQEEPSLSGLRLYKTSVAVSTKSKVQAEAGRNLTWESFPVNMIIAAQLLVLIDRTGTRRFIIHDDNDTSGDGILIWIFNPSLRYSSSSSSLSLPITSQRAMKVFYQLLSQTELRSLLNPQAGTSVSTALEDLALPTGIYEDVKRGLETSNAILPHSARNFKEWKVGLLDVYEERSIT
ncbi:hypothetical protein VTO42DRAFT_6554 [Malbranchea cinnamomea]